MVLIHIFSFILVTGTEGGFMLYQKREMLKKAFLIQKEGQGESLLLWEGSGPDPSWGAWRKKESLEHGKFQFDVRNISQRWYSKHQRGLPRKAAIPTPWRYWNISQMNPPSNKFALLCMGRLMAWPEVSSYLNYCMILGIIYMHYFLKSDYSFSGEHHKNLSLFPYTNGFNKIKV